MAQLVSRHKVVLGVAGTAAAIVVALAIVAFPWSAHPGGDPGGRLMAKIARVVRVVPGLERGRIPWVASSSLECQSPAPCASKAEPRWDSCDGMAGTFGWDSVVIQVGFQWTRSQRALLDLINGRLRARGWAKGDSVPPWEAGYQSGPHWIWPPGHHPAQAFSLALDSPNGRHQWTAVIEAKPQGQLVHGC